MDGLHMVPLATARTGFEAKVLAARLGSEGILWQLRGGSVDSVYPVGSVDVLVALDDLERARELLTVIDEDGIVTRRAAGGEDVSEGWDRTEWWLAALVVGLLLGFVALRMFSL